MASRNINEQLADDPLFFKWVYHPDDHTNEWMDRHIRQNPELANELAYLKEQLLLIRFSGEKMRDHEKRAVARNILKRTIDPEPLKVRKDRFSFLRYAAVALLFFALGGSVVFLASKKQDTTWKTPEIQNSVMVNKPTLVLPEGEWIDLKEKESTLDYSQDGKVVVNEQQVIDFSDKPGAERKINQLVIPYGSRSKVTLSDSSVVWLNAGSRLIYPAVFSSSKREVFLFGEAFFMVSEDKKRPFVVKTAELSIRVLGTKFNVCAYPEDKVIQTVLTEGRIALKRNGASLFEEEVIVLPDQMASYSKEDQVTRIKKVDPSFYVLWKDGLLKFRNEDLSRIIKQLERFYNISFTYDNPLYGGIKISGKLDLKEDRDEVLQYISKVALIEFKKEGGRRYRIK